MNRSAIVFVCLVAAAATVGGVVTAQDGQTRGSPDLHVFVEDQELSVGHSTVELGIVNRGDMVAGSGPDERVTTARGVAVSADGDGPLEVETDTVTPGAITTQSPATAPIRVSVPADAEPGSYDLDVEVEYTYTSTIAPRGNVVNEITRTESFTVTVEVPEGPQFAISEVETDAQTGGEGSLFVTVRNEGTEAATDARVGVRSTSSGVDIGSGAGGGDVETGSERSTEVHAGTLEPDEERTLEYETAVNAPGNYTAEATVTYEDDRGLTEQSRSIPFGVAPSPEQRFDIEAAETSLSVGATGRIAGTVRNDGPEPIEDGVLVATAGSERLQLGDGEYALPELDPGEAADFEFDAEVSGQADPGARQVSFTVEHTRNGATATSDRQTERIEIEPRQPVFEVDAAETMEAGSSTVLTAQVTNNRGETLTDITANLYADSPLSTGTDESFVAELDPGETTTVDFELSVSGAAMPNTYPVELDFQYTDARGDDRISEVSQEPIEVTEPDDDGNGSISPLTVVLVLAVVGAVAYAVYRRR